MGANTNNATVISNANQRITAIKKHLGTKDEVFVAGHSTRLSALVTTFQQAIDTRTQVVATKGEYKAALAARGSAEENRATTDEALKAYVLQRFGADSAEAHDFGYSARKVSEKSVETKMRAVLLNQATREARNTKGKKQRLKVKGTLPDSGAPAGAPTPPQAAPSQAAPPTMTPANQASPSTQNAPAPSATH